MLQKAFFKKKLNLPGEDLCTYKFALVSEVCEKVLGTLAMILVGTEEPEQNKNNTNMHIKITFLSLTIIYH